MIYFDSAATTKPNQEVIDAMMPYFTEMWHNPSSLYSPSKKVKKDVEDARANIAQYINAESDEIYFTSGGSEANCMAIMGFIQNRRNHGDEPFVITTAIEHKSIIECCEESVPNFLYVRTDKRGRVNLESLEFCLDYALQYSDGVDILVSVQFANNEIGTIQDIREIAKIVHKYGATLHTDAVQAFGQIPIDVKELGIDMMSVSGHKIHAPKGIGFLYKRNGVNISPIIYGTQENGLRGGTENVPYIIGLSKAVDIVRHENTPEKMRLMTDVRNVFIAQLNDIGCGLHGSLIYRLPNNINVAFPNKATGEALIYMLDMSGIYISAGSACNSHSTSISHVLKAIGVPEDEALKTIRITIPDDIDFNECVESIDKFISEFKKQLEILDIS